MATFEWSDRQGSRDRQAWLLLVDGGKVCRFTGSSIPGIATVIGNDYKKNGKWSSTTYRLELTPGVIPHAHHDGWETGSFREALRADRWVDAANVLGVGVPEIQRFLREWRPKAADHYDAVETALEAVDAEAPTGGATLTVNFGGFTRRQTTEGAWRDPVMVSDPDGSEIGRVTPHPESGWGSPITTGAIRLLDCTRTSGHGGGYVSLRLAVPEGATARHGK